MTFILPRPTLDQRLDGLNADLYATRCDLADAERARGAARELGDDRALASAVRYRDACLAIVEDLTQQLRALEMERSQPTWDAALVQRLALDESL